MRFTLWLLLKSMCQQMVFHFWCIHLSPTDLALFHDNMVHTRLGIWKTDLVSENVNVIIHHNIWVLGLFKLGRCLRLFDLFFEVWVVFTFTDLRMLLEKAMGEILVAFQTLFGSRWAKVFYVLFVFVELYFVLAKLTFDHGLRGVIAYLFLLSLACEKLESFCNHCSLLWIHFYSKY